MSTDKRTKAQILAEMAELRERLEEAEKRPVPRPLDRVPIADALAACVRALDALGGRRDIYSSHRSDDVAHVLNVLCEKYNVRRVERIEVPCELTHVENLTTAHILDAVKREAGMFNV